MFDTKDKLNILVVDDSRTIRATINKVLSPNYNIVQAVDGEDAWEKLLEIKDIKMIISDILMPKLDGYGLICRIRAATTQPEIMEIPIVVITSSDDDITRERAHACGANDFVVKPVGAAELLERANFHTEAKLSGNQPALDTSTFSDVESAVIEAPDINTTLEIICGAKEGVVKPYVLDLAIEVLPLLEYCNNTFDLELGLEIETIKSTFKKYSI